MRPPDGERRPGLGTRDGAMVSMAAATRHQSSARWTPGRIAVARCRARLVALAQAAGRPLLTLDAEREHLDARRRGEAARLRAGGAG
ncbi:hypothetical protein [Frankia gtarii]|uniref:hypothetical protein n=1 Tax=Frankia gtarii TaxID=2950102 RepID=UPI0021C0CA0E|nr:hypothetical protein [Frankia gtarii]